MAQTRVIVFDLSGEGVGPRGIVSDIEADGGQATIVDLSGEGRLAQRYGDAEAVHVASLRELPRVRDARYLAAAWMQSIPFVRLASGRRLVEELQDDRGAIWWQFDISLQEQAFLQVRLIETAHGALRHYGATAWTVSGENPRLPWERELLEDACRATGVPVHRVIVPAATVAPTRARRRRVPDRRLFGRAQTPQRVGGRRPSPGELLFGRLMALALLVPAALAAVIVGLAALVGGLVGRLPARILARLSPARVASGLRARPGLKRRLAIVAMLLVLAAVIVAAALLGAPVRRAALVVLAVLAAVAVVRVLGAPSSLGPFETLTWAARGPWRPRALRRGERDRPQPVSHEAAARTPLPEGRRRVVAFVDEGDIRVRRGSGRPRAYLPYLEGVIEALRGRADADVFTVHVGVPRSRRPWSLQLEFAWRRRVRRRALRLMDWVTEDDLKASSKARSDRVGEWERLREDERFTRAFQYGGVALWPYFSELVQSLLLSTDGTVLHQRALGRILKDVDPDVVVSYNFEGVFRRWIPVALDRRIPVVGMQQALGPYVHGLDRRVAGYRYSDGDSRVRVPMPDRIGVWGERDVRELGRFGHAAQRLAVVGSPRTDVFVREAGRVSRRAVLRRLGLPESAEVVGFSAVMHVLGTHLTREDHWRATLGGLVDALTRRPNGYLLIKPWPGEPTELIEPAIMELGNERVRLLDSASDLHNVEVLSILDVLVGTFSSMFSEALTVGVLPVLMDYPETRYYFGPDVDMFAPVATAATDPAEAVAAAIALLDLPASERERRVAGAIEALKPIFGPLDGGAAERMADVVLASALRR